MKTSAGESSKICSGYSILCIPQGVSKKTFHSWDIDSQGVVVSSECYMETDHFSLMILPPGAAHSSKGTELGYTKCS
jgi:hypothetical protein